MARSSIRPDAIYTIGHSTHSADAFVELLQASGIEAVADVRLIPQSKRHPHFGAQPLAQRLSSDAIAYRHFPALGGRRRPRPDSVNTAWRVEAFRGYADYMQTAEFSQAVEELLGFAAKQRTAVMCAESVWWQCHRRLLADALVVLQIPVLHILPGQPAKRHDLSEFARETSGGITYPGLL
jgi:uncharacterized protein (DUF488 family)